MKDKVTICLNKTLLKDYDLMEEIKKKINEDIKIENKKENKEENININNWVFLGENNNENEEGK